jgi:hypothetical protein
MYSQQQPGAQPPAQAYQQYPPQQYPQPQQYQQPPPQQYQQTAPPQYQQAPPQQYPPQQPPAPPAPPAPQKDSVVAEEFKKYVLTQAWQVLSHDATPGNHVIKLAPPAGKKLAKGDVKKAQISVKSMGPQPAVPGAPPGGPTSVQVSLDTEEKAGFFGSDRKSYPLWMNVDEEVDASMQATPGLRDKVRNICTQAKITMPPPPPAPPQPAYQQPPAQAPPPAYAPPPPGAPPQQPMAAPPPIPQAQPQQPQPPPAPMQPTYQPPAPQPQYQAQPPPPAYQPQQYQQPAQPQYQQAPPQQYGAPPAPAGQPPQPQQWQQKLCPNPNCQSPNAANAQTCYRCGYRLP